MAEQGERLRCTLCGNVVEVVESGGNPEITCCGQAMAKV